MNQAEGAVGRVVAGMIRRSIRNRLRNAYWRPAVGAIKGPAILYANHNGWLDGYLMFHLAEELGLRCLAWIDEFDAFPPFGHVGGLRFTKGDTAARVSAIRTTMRLMRNEKQSLVLFPEGVLHRPGPMLPFGRAFETVAKCSPDVQVVPVAIAYEMSIHERPEAWLYVDEPRRFESLENSRRGLESALEVLRSAIRADQAFAVLAPGTPSVNERYDMRRLRKP